MSESELVIVWSRVWRRVAWQWVASIIVLALSLCLLAYKAYDSWEALIAYEWQIRYLYLIPSFLLFLFQLVIIVWGWQAIMNSLAQPLSFRKHVKIYSYTNLTRRIPAGIFLAIAGRAYAYRQDVPARVPTLGSFLEFLLTVVTGLPIAALAGIGLGFYLPEIGIALAVAAFVVELTAVHPAVLGKLFQLVRHQTLQSELTYRDTLLWTLIYTLIWLLSGTGLFAIACLFVDMSMAQLPTTIGVWVLASLISYLTFFSPSSLGVKELSLTFLLGIILPDPLPLLIALAIRGIWTVYDVLVAGLATLLL